MVKILFATNNENKLREIKNISHEINADVEIYSLDDLKMDIKVRETFDTLEENAIKKAKVVYKRLDKKYKDYIVVSEDFGFFIEEYPEICGVKSKRWFKGTDDDRNKEVVRLMKNIDNRKCYYKSVFATYDGVIERVFSGYTYGTIAEEVRGTNGFAYDSIFVLDNDKTIAELEPEEKDEISSRREAFEYLLKSIISEQ
ncbi:MAG: non-canonical purine NTP pyrophosphatase [Clostridia bacterium]|nr:non-canonical purine NTP pyrophosphatase [Clostridia bacterium]